jgi:hypothetical protein
MTCKHEWSEDFYGLKCELCGHKKSDDCNPHVWEYYHDAIMCYTCKSHLSKERANQLEAIKNAVHTTIQNIFETTMDNSGNVYYIVPAIELSKVLDLMPKQRHNKSKDTPL